MKEHEPKRYFSNIVGPPTNDQHYSETPYGKIELKIGTMFLSFKRKLTKWRKNDY
jgi:hypothetical protein